MKQKNIIILILILSLIVALLVGGKFIINRLKPKTIQPDYSFGVLPEQKIDSYQNTGQINYSLSVLPESLKILPMVLSIYKIDRLEINQETVFGTIDETKLLEISPEGELTYRDSSIDLTGLITGLIPGDEEALKIAKEKLSQLGIKEDNQFILQNRIKYQNTTGYEFYEVKDRQQAKAIFLELIPTILNYPLLTNNPEIAPIIIRIGPEGKILFLHLFLNQINWQNQGTYPVKSAPQILADLQSQKANIVKLENYDIPLGSIEKLNLQNINITNLSLAYYQETGSSYLQPIFVLAGIATMADQTTTGVTLYLPAVTSSPPEP